MRLKNEDYRQMAHSIKYMEYYWAEYQMKYPDKAYIYRYKKEITQFIERDTYSKILRAKRSSISSDKILKKSQYEKLMHYSNICKDLKLELHV